MKHKKWVAAIVLAVLASLAFGGFVFAGPLHDAAKKGQASVVKRLLDSGADVNEADDLGVTALHWAVWSGNSQTIDTLLERGADIQAESAFGSTPLHWAAASGKGNTIRRLIATGAGVNSQNYAGMTPIQVARIKNNGGARSELAKAGGREPGSNCKKSKFVSARGYVGYRVDCQ